MFTNTKLKAFTAGTMNVSRPLSKREEEELKKRKLKEEEENALKEFEESFVKSDNINRAWVKGGTVNPEDPDKDAKASGSLYKPTARYEIRKTEPVTPKFEHTPSRMSKLGKDVKKPTNLEIFKEELKAMQEEREARQAARRRLRGERSPSPVASTSSGRKSRFDTSSRTAEVFAPPVDFDYPYDIDGDKNTTNLFLGNINPDVTEQQLCQYFGRFGPLASVKIMWPRSEEERSRGRNCGFVAFMSRKDGERALDRCRGRDCYGFEMKMGWGKPVPIPPQPIYVPPTLVELIKPPPPSGLPFNAQPRDWIKSLRERLREHSHLQQQVATKIGPGLMSRDDRENLLQQSGDSDTSGDKTRRPFDIRQMTPEEISEVLKDAVVKVVIPTERSTLHLINRMVEFVIKEGPDIEAAIMGREMNNPQFRFLFDYYSPEHTYYRWKMYSILHGDSTTSWRLDEFRMYENGPWWRPPPINVFVAGMPEEMVVDEELPMPEAPAADIPQEPAAGRAKKSADTAEPRRPGEGCLLDSQREHLQSHLRDLEPQRGVIGEAMMWCLEHADASQDIVDCISDAVAVTQTTLTKKIARIYLVSDILRNCHARVPNASLFRRYFEKALPEMFKHLHEYYINMESRIKAELFKQKVVLCFQSWEDANIYTNDFLIHLQNIFLGLLPSKIDRFSADVNSPASGDGEAIDGRPLVDYEGDLDGVPLDDEPLLGGGKKFGAASTLDDSDLDGEPLVLSPPHALEKDGSGFGEKKNTALPTPQFIPSKWETVDLETLQAEAVTTSKWDMFDNSPDTQTPVKTSPPVAVPPTLHKRKMDEDGEVYEEDIDGRPLESVSSTPSTKRDSNKPNHKTHSISSTSTTTKPQNHSPTSATGHTSLNDDKRRAQLREVELMVVKYQDEVEADAKTNKRKRLTPEEIQAKVAKYRKRLMERLNSGETLESSTSKEKGNSTTSSSRDTKETSKSSSSHHHSHRNKSRSRSPIREKDKSSSTSSRRRDSKERRRRSRSRSSSSDDDTGDVVRSVVRSQVVVPDRKRRRDTSEDASCRRRSRSNSATGKRSRAEESGRKSRK